MEQRAGVPWGLWFCLLAVAGPGLILLRIGQGWDTEIFWPGMGAALVAALAATVILRWLSNWLWGLAAGLLITAHPLYWHWVGLNAVPLWGEALGLLVLASTLAGWRLVFSKSCAWISWLLVTVVIILSLGLAWPLQPRVGLLASLLVLGSLGTACFLGCRLWSGKESPALGNIILAGLLALAGPAAGLVLAQTCANLENFPRHRSLTGQEDIGELINKGFDFNHYYGFLAVDLDRWAWPFPWVVVPAMTYGWWRSLRRGWKDWMQHHPPLSWSLSLFAMVEALSTIWNSVNAQETNFLPRATLAVLLTVYAVADVLRGISDRLVLTPPS